MTLPGYAFQQRHWIEPAGFVRIKADASTPIGVSSAEPPPTDGGPEASPTPVRDPGDAAANLVAVSPASVIRRRLLRSSGGC